MKTPTQYILEAHRKNIQACTNFEMLCAAQLKYLDLLIARESVQDQIETLEDAYIVGSQS